MKKAKVMLSALAIIAVVGGAVAAKAKTSGFLVYTFDEASNTCIKLDNHRYKFDPAGLQLPQATTTASAAVIPTADCQQPITVDVVEQ